MKHSPLSELIRSLEYGTQLHISVVFLQCYGNEKTQLPKDQRIHASSVCEEAKATRGGITACVRCRNTVLKWCIRHKRALSGYCVNGVYEYCHPVVYDGVVVAVIFIGNILKDRARQQEKLSRFASDVLLSTMETRATEEDCGHLACVLESYILLLLDTYGKTVEKPSNALIGRIKDYVAEHLAEGVCMSELATVFCYHEKYLGRLFKEKTGVSVKEYCNQLRIQQAKRLLMKHDIPICEVAAAVGFDNVAYFSRLFKHHVGCAPREHREKDNECRT